MAAKTLIFHLEALTPTHSTTFFRGSWIVISSFINKAIFLSRKGLLSLFNKWNNSWLLVGVEFLFSCSTLHLTGELSSWTLEDKSHNYARPCIIPYQERINRHLCEKSSCSTYPEKTLDLQRDYLKHDRRKRQERLNLLWSLLQSRLSINNQIIHECSEVAWSQILVRINHSLSRSSSKNFSSPEIITAKNLQRKLVKIRKK